MNCKNCGSHIDEGQKVCNICGTKVGKVDEFVVINDIQYSKRNLNMVKITMFIVVAIATISPFIFSSNSSFGFSDLAEVEEEVSDFNKVNVGGYQLSVPKKYDTLTEYNKVIITDQKAKWTSNIEIRGGNYDNIINKTKDIQTLISNQGINILSDAKIETYNNTEFVNLDVEKYGVKTLLSFVKISDNTIAVITSTNENNTIDYSIIDLIEPIIASRNNSYDNY